MQVFLRLELSRRGGVTSGPRDNMGKWGVSAGDLTMLSNLVVQLVIM